MPSGVAQQRRPLTIRFQTIANFPETGVQHRLLRIQSSTRRNSVKKFLFGLILGLLIPAAVVYVYFRFGYAPIAASAAPMPFEKNMARMTLHAHIQKEAPKKDAPIPADEPNLTAGASLYKENCSFCHGLPNQKATLAAKGMFPIPPQLWEKDEMVTDDPVGVTYWKVSHGIRMTGMPAFGETLTATQVWQISQLLANADKLPAQTQSALSKPAEETAAPAPSTPGPAQPHHHDHHSH
jgi:mono/diheme cytochrome c family protein